MVMKGKVNAQRVHKKNIGLDEIAKCKEQRITKAVFVTSFASDYFPICIRKRP